MIGSTYLDFRGWFWVHREALSYSIDPFNFISLISSFYGKRNCFSHQRVKSLLFFNVSCDLLYMLFFGQRRNEFSQVSAFKRGVVVFVSGKKV